MAVVSWLGDIGSECCLVFDGMAWSGWLDAEGDPCCCMDGEPFDAGWFNAVEHNNDG